MTWTRPTMPLGSVSAAPRLWHYAATRNETTTVALCGETWETGLSEGKTHCTPAARCPGCEAIRSVQHGTPEDKAKVTLRQSLRRAAERRNRDPYVRMKED